jgi:hypothetical protein
MASRMIEVGSGTAEASSSSLAPVVTDTFDTPAGTRKDPPRERPDELNA